MQTEGVQGVSNALTYSGLLDKLFEAVSDLDWIGDICTVYHTLGQLKTCLEVIHQPHEP